MFWFYVLPLGFLLTQYTITGFDASAHISEETHGASTNAAKGVWSSIFYSALIGWIVLLAITFAVNRTSTAPNERLRLRLASAILANALDPAGRKFVLIDLRPSASCSAALACLTSASRMCLRVLARPRHARARAQLSTVNHERVPFYAVLAMAAAGAASSPCRR